MTNPLYEAANLIEAYAETLTTSQSTCQCCGVTRYDDFSSYQKKIELTAMVRKLRTRFKPLFESKILT